MLLDAVLQMHAWASGRFKHKTQLEGQKLENQNLRIIKTEAEQGTCSPTPSSSTSAFSFLPSVSKFRCGAIGIVGMLRLPSKSCLESAMCYLLFSSGTAGSSFLIILCGSAKFGLRNQC